MGSRVRNGPVGARGPTGILPPPPLQMPTGGFCDNRMRKEPANRAPGPNARRRAWRFSASRRQPTCR